MTKSKKLRCFSALFLVFTFMLLSFAIVPMYNVSSDNSAALPFNSTSNSGASLSLITNYSMDYQEAESTAYKYGFLQSLRPKLLNTSINLAIILSSVGLLILIYGHLYAYEIFLKISSVKIAEYLHDKDGMI